MRERGPFDSPSANEKWQELCLYVGVAPFCLMITGGKFMDSLEPGRFSPTACALAGCCFGAYILAAALFTTRLAIFYGKQKGYLKERAENQDLVFASGVAGFLAISTLAVFTYVATLE